MAEVRGSKAGEPDPIDPDTIELLLLSVTRMHRLQLKYLEALDPPLTLRQFRILWRIGMGYTSLSALSRVAFRSLPSMSESVDLLIRRDLVARRVSPTDRRAAELSLTPLGEAAYDAGVKALRDVGDQFFGSLSPTQRKNVRRISQQMFDFAGEQLVNGLPER